MGYGTWSFQQYFSRDIIDLYESNDNIDQQLIINLGICYSFN